MSRTQYTTNTHTTVVCFYFSHVHILPQCDSDFTALFIFYISQYFILKVMLFEFEENLLSSADFAH